LITAAGASAIEPEARINACGALFRMASTNALNRSSLVSAGAIPMLLRQASESVHELQEVTLPPHVAPPRPATADNSLSSGGFSGTGTGHSGFKEPAFGSGTVFVTDCNDASESGLVALFRGSSSSGGGGGGGGSGGGSVNDAAASGGPVRLQVYCVPPAQLPLLSQTDPSPLYLNFLCRLNGM
jgi:hypothetical protein